MLSIIIPARNEEDNLESILDYFTKGMSNMDYEIIFINDFSEDNTFKKAETYLKTKIILKFLTMKKKGSEVLLISGSQNVTETILLS